MRENLQEWFDQHRPDEKLIWKDGLWQQVQFIRDEIPNILSRSYEEYIGVQKQLFVVSTHTSKSVLLPVFELNWNKYKFIMRYNFHDWKVSVSAPYGVNLDVDFMNLFKIDEQINQVYCEGFRNDLVFKSFSENKNKFTIEISDNN